MYGDKQNMNYGSLTCSFVSIDVYWFLAAIAALYVAMSVCRSVGWSDGWSVVVNKFQRVLNVLKVYVTNMLHMLHMLVGWSVGMSASNKFQSYNT